MKIKLIPLLWICLVSGSLGQTKQPPSPLSPEIQAIFAAAQKLDIKDRLAAFEKGIDVAISKHDRPGEALMYLACGFYANEYGQGSKAITYYQLSLPIWQELGDVRAIGAAYQNIGAVHNRQGRRLQAIEFFQKALPFLRTAGDRKTEATTQSNIGTAYDYLGQNAKALSYFTSTLQTRREIKDQAGEATSLDNIGHIYTKLGKHAIALELYIRANKIATKIGDTYLEATTLNNIGMACAATNRNSKALIIYERSLEKWRQIGNRGGEAQTLENIGRQYAITDRTLAALRYYNSALKIEQEVGDLGSQASSMNKIGLCHEKLRRTAEALKDYQEAVRLDKEVRNREGEAESLGNIALLYHRLGRSDRAIIFAKQAVNLTQSLRQDISALGKDLQGSYLGLVSGRYRTLADWLAEANRLQEAEQVLDLLKDVEYFDLVRGEDRTHADLVNLTPLEAKWIEKYEKLGDDLGGLASERIALLELEPAKRSAVQTQRLQELRAKVDDAAEAFQVFLSETENAFNSVGASPDRVHDLKGSEALQRALRDLPNHPAAIYTLITGDGLRLIVSTPGLSVPRQSKSKLDTKALNKKILAFRETLADPSLDPRPLGAELYDVIVRPIENDLMRSRTQTLMWSLDGPLRYIPLWALYDKSSKQYFLEKYPCSIFTPRTVDRLINSPRKWTGAEFGVSTGGKIGTLVFRPLPGVDRELAVVHEFLGGQKPMINGAFTYNSFRDSLDAGTSVVHIATHFHFQPGDDSASFLLLGGGASLSIEKLKNLDATTFSKVDLLVLSACNTQMSGDADGSEFEGLALLAQLKGAGSVIATLWPVRDGSTALLMGEFYRLHKMHPGWTKLQSLRFAQLEMLHDQIVDGSPSKSGPSQKNLKKRLRDGQNERLTSYAHPFYWAPFVLTGNWR